MGRVGPSRGTSCCRLICVTVHILPTACFSPQPAAGTADQPHKPVQSRSGFVIPFVLCRSRP